ncbi:MAG: twin-arginine translocase TatA/TatE family subunit [Hyphomicrobiales bacterium]|nr:twin-arginine translocase TatA/TatE family subunit [Hyphomicrobiales bacterium]
MHAPGIWGILVVAVVVVLLFGRGKISGVMGEVATGIKAFQKGMRDDEQAKPASSRLDATSAPIPDAAEVDRSKDA